VNQPHAPLHDQARPQARKAVYTGSFDPITLGHLDVIERASRIFDPVVVGVGINPEKQPIFTLAERVRLVRDSTAHLDTVQVELFSGLAGGLLPPQPQASPAGGATGRGGRVDRACRSTL